MRKGIKIELSIAGAVAILSIWLVYRGDHGVGVNSVWWLPREARNITYYRHEAMAIAEFDIQQNAFEKWCASQGMPLRELKEGEYGIVRRSVGLLRDRDIMPRINGPNEPLTGWDGAEPDVDMTRPTKTLIDKTLVAGDLFYEEI